MLTSKILLVRSTENIKFISEHSAFPFVFVWVWHEEPGNLHPFNFDAQITYSPTTTMNFNFEPEFLPTPHFSDENVEICGTQKLKGNHRLKVVEKLAKVE